MRFTYNDSPYGTFREGNGRTQRVFITQLAKNAGYTLDWSGISQSQMIDASIHSMRVDNTKLEQLFGNITTPTHDKPLMLDSNEIKATKCLIHDLSVQEKNIFLSKYPSLSNDYPYLKAAVIEVQNHSKNKQSAANKLIGQIINKTLGEVKVHGHKLEVKSKSKSKEYDVSDGL